MINILTSVSMLRGKVFVTFKQSSFKEWQMYVTSHYLTYKPESMKLTILPILLLVVLAIGCAPEYKLGQTPDDVYYSPAKALPEDAIVKKQDDHYQQNINYTDDRFLQMKVHNYSLWSSLDDYAYWNDSRYDFYPCNPTVYNYYSKLGCGCGASFYGYPYANYYGSLAFYNYWYGYTPVYYVGGYKNTWGGGSNSGSYLSAYKNKTYNNSNYTHAAKSIASQVPVSGGIGTTIRRILSPSSPAYSSGNNTSWDRAARTFTPTNTTSNSTFSTSSNAGGHSGGYSSSGSSAGGGRATRN